MIRRAVAAIRRLFHVERPAPELEIPRDAAREFLLLFVRGGGSITLSEWTSLPFEMREALAEAHRTLRAETLAALANAIRSPAGVVDLLRNVGDGDPAEEAIAGLALASAGARFMASRVPLGANVGQTAPRTRVGSPGAAP